MTDRRSALVTGVSSGIGRACAASLIEEGWRVFGSVRKEEDAKAAQEALGDHFTPLLFDVTDTDKIKAAAETVAEALADTKLGGLVNNAGVAIGGPLEHIPLEEVQRQFDINVYGVLRVSQAFLPILGTDKNRTGAPGKIINMSSIAGRLASPFMAPYAMSKHALEAMSDSMRRELMNVGIDVVVVGPGAIKTPIWEKGDDLDIDQYRETAYAGALQKMKASMLAYGNTGLPPEAVGKIVADILAGRAKKPRYPVVDNLFMNWILPTIAPKRVVDNAIAKRFGILDEGI